MILGVRPRLGFRCPSEVHSNFQSNDQSISQLRFPGEQGRGLRNTTTPPFQINQLGIYGKLILKKVGFRQIVRCALAADIGKPENRFSFSGDPRFRKSQEKQSPTPSPQPAP